ncbi:MAG: hypothetical protein ACOC9N_02765 [Gemmatimonadota bacterium]
MVGRALLTDLRDRSPVALYIAALSFGSFVVVLSVLFNLAEYHNGAQHVGYMSALNWSVGFTIFTPLFVLFLLRALGSVGEIARRLDHNGMLVDAGFRPLDDGAVRLERLWTARLEQLGPIALVLVVASFVAALAYWLYESGGPLLLGTDAPEIDWAVRYEGSSAAREWANAAFSFVAYLQQGVFLSALMLTGVVSYALAELFHSLATHRHDLRVIPSSTSRDRRRGFQVFAPIPENLLLAVAFAYGHLYLGRIWNVFQHQHEGSLQQLVIADLVDGFASGGFTAGLSALFETQELGTEGRLILITSLVLGAVSLFFVFVMLRGTARDAGQALTEVLERLPPDATYDDQPVEEILERIRSMSVWPVKYPRPSQLMVIGIFAITVMFFYRFGVFYVGILLAYVMAQMLRKETIGQQVEEATAVDDEPPVAARPGADRSEPPGARGDAPR